MRRSVLKRAGDVVAPLWSSGLALTIVMALLIVLSSRRAQARLPIYALLGTVFPLAVLALAVPTGWDRSRQMVRAALAWFCLSVSVFLVVQYSNATAVSLGLVQWALTATILRSASNSGSIGERLGSGSDEPSVDPWPVLTHGLSLFVTIVCWTVGIQLLRGGTAIFDGFGFADQSAFVDWVRTSWSAVPVLGAAFGLVLASTYGVTRRSGDATDTAILNLVANGVAVAIFAALSLRSDQWAGPHFADAYWHWSYFVGPAEDIRQGGWLLWDLPSWYGFGSILLVALLPTVSAWKSMYFLNAAALCFSAVLIYVVLRALRPGWIGWLFASTVTTAGVFLLPGRSEDITGPQLWPSAAAFRFVWVYMLLSILWWGYRRHLGGKATGFILPLGTATWIAGMTWAFESAIYSSAIWLPAFALLVWEHTGSVVPVRRRLMLVAAALTVPLAALAVVGVAIAGYYWLGAGHLPDVSAYYEVALAFGALFRSVFYKGSVGVWFLLLVFCAASTAVVSLFRRASLWALALAVASWAALWSTSSYLVVKGDAYTLLSGTPLILACLGLLLWLVNCHDGRVSAGSLPHLTFAAVLIPLFCLAFGNLPKLAERAADVRLGYAALATRLPVLDQVRRGLLNAAGVRPSDGLIIVDEPGLADAPLTLSTPERPPAPWLPIRSWDRMVYFGTVVVSPARMQTYVSRSIARGARGGYVLVKKETLSSPTWTWLFDELRRDYVEATALDGNEYLLLRYHSPSINHDGFRPLGDAAAVAAPMAPGTAGDDCVGCRHACLCRSSSPSR